MMSDAAIAIVVSGSITIATMVVGFLTLWIKLKYGAEKLDSVEKRVAVVQYQTDGLARALAVESKAAGTAAGYAAGVADEKGKNGPEIK
jgi:hypothetical protein